MKIYKSQTVMKLIFTLQRLATLTTCSLKRLWRKKRQRNLPSRQKNRMCGRVFFTIHHGIFHDNARDSLRNLLPPPKKESIHCF